MNINNCTFGGNVSRDVEMFTTNSGTEIASFGIAVNGWGKDSKAMFLTVKCFGQKAEIAEKYVKKGGPVAVCGRLEIEEWTAKDGTKGKTVTVIANELILGPKKDSGGPYSPASEGSTPSRQNTATPRSQDSGSGSGDDDLPFAPNVC